MSGSTVDSLAARDARHVWHPFTQHGAGVPPLPVRSARGARIALEDGREIIDGISSWWVNLHGHAEPRLAAAIAEQAQKLEHVIFAGFTHEPAVRLAETLIAATTARGARFDKVFYSDNGSTAVEVALKLAFQWHVNRGDRARTRFLALRGSYHGDTLGAMAVAGDPDYHAVFKPLLPPVDFVAPGDVPALERVLSEQGAALAAFIVEPMVQAAGGMAMHSAEYLRAAVTLCRARGIPVIFDEVFTGFHRTGPCFAFEHPAIAPDFLCLSKGLTGGFLPLSVTLTTREIFEAFSGEGLERAFLHGHSYTANPISCAAAIASWELLQEPETQSRLQRLCAATARHVGRLAAHPAGARARHLGTIGAIDVLDVDGGYARNAGLSARLRAEALRRGVLLRPLGRTLYSLPPYCVSDDELARIYTVIEELLEEVSCSK